MGVERAVTRWYAIRQRLLDEIVDLEEQLAQSQQEGQSQQPKGEPPVAEAELTRQLAEAQHKLRDLGPCPKVMMG